MKILINLIEATLNINGNDKRLYHNCFDNLPNFYLIIYNFIIKLISTLTIISKYLIIQIEIISFDFLISYFPVYNISLP